MRTFGLPLKLLWRNWRSGEVKILSGALLLAVAVVTAINVFADRLERSLVAQSSSFLGADRIVRSSSPIPDAWRERAEQAGVEQARTVLFSSMVFAGDNMHLASVKAVTPGYPLKGRLEISDRPFAVEPADILIAQSIPSPGEAWVDSRLLPLLDVALGNEVYVGEKALQVTRVLVREPDRGSGFSLFGARLMMNVADLPETQVIQPGSRVRYQWLLAADEPLLLSFLDSLAPQLTDHQKIVDLQSSQQGLAKTLKTGRRFLLLAGVIGVLLAGVALAIAAQRFAARHVDQVALMKSLGAGTWRIRQLYMLQLVLLAIVASMAGLLLGEVIQQLVARTLGTLFDWTLSGAGWKAYGIGVLTGFVCLLFFALPPLWHLPTVPPLKVLRRELAFDGLRTAARASLGALAVLLLVWLYSNDIKLTVVVMLGFTAVLLVSSLGALGLLALGRAFGQRHGHIWRLALASLQRRRGQSVMQMLVFAAAMMLLLTLISVRTSLIDDWQVQLPEQAPNHFLVNIAPYQVEGVRELLGREGAQTTGLYPMVRGRLTHINDQLPSERVKHQAEVLLREANLSWVQSLRTDNRLVGGVWWDQWRPPQVGKFGVSVEAEIARDLELKLGDKLRFSLGGLTLEAHVASIRELDWDSMQPNFYFLFSPGALDAYSPMYLTSVYLPPEKKLLINDLLRQFPTILVIELDKVIDQIRIIVDQVSSGVELVLWLVLCGGLLVLLAAVNASMDSRRQEAGILRAMGSSRKLVMGSLLVEFSVLGLFAGLLAVAGAEVLLLGLQRWVLDTPLSPHYILWLVSPLIGAVLIGGLGVWSCRKVVTVAPAVVLRDASH